ncbi:MAG: PAS domain-containing sensor histidine kinase, partial [Croceitalea sp.]|nr:PAS domain-containing sensor histidine kinase [Croceitalea sp.]
GILIVNEQQTIVASNDKANTMFGYPSEGLNQKHISSIIPKKSHAVHKKHFQEFVKKKEKRPMGQGLDLFGIKKDNTNFPLEIGLNPFKLLQKQYVMALVVDITERKKAEQAINHWFQIFNESLNEIYVFDAHSFLFINVNRGAQLNLGYDIDELQQKSILDVNTKLSKESLQRLVYPLIKSKKQKVEFQSYHTRKDGSTYPVDVHLQLSMIGKTQVLVAIVIDITELKNYTENLEKTVELRTQQLSDALKAEKKLNELKTKFLSLVSHEFKTPLTSILTSTSLLSKYTLTEQQEKRNKHIESIKSKVKYLNAILNDFLSIERLEAGEVKYNLTEFSLSKLINEVIYSVSGLLKEGQRIQYPKNIDGITLTFDERILALSLSNLLNNAIKYSPEGSNIEIVVNEDPKMLTITIIDEGLGIPEADQQFIFDRYFRASNVLITQGTGIGLNIARQHIKNLGGEITFVSTVEEGSKFSLFIPTSKE